MDKTTEVKNEPLVSILMLTYNRAHFLPQAIASVLSQDYQNWQLLIIDDGSKDNTTSLLATYSDQRIKVISHKENAGLFSRRKESLSYVAGKYVAILDSDDYWLESEKITKQVDYLETHDDCVLVGTNALLVDEDGHNLGEISFESEDTGIRKKILRRNQFVHSAVLMRTDALKLTAGYQPTLAEDLELFLQLGQIGTLANLPEKMTAHRVHKNSLNDHGLKMSRAIDKIIKKHRAHYPGYTWANTKNRLRLIHAHLFGDNK